MSVTQMDEHDLEAANRYLAGQLTDAECAAFETRLVTEPQLMQELEASARLKVGLEKLRESGQLAQVMRPSRGWAFGFAAAAAVAVLAIGAAALLQSSFRFGEPSLLAATSSALTDRQGNLLPAGGTFTVLRKRVATEDSVIELPPPNHFIEIKVLPESAAAGQRYRVSLWQQRQDVSARKLASVARLRPATDGYVSVFADATSLAPGEYRLVVAPDDAPDTTTRGDVFRVRLTRTRN